ncbi:hypothetical protein BS50DRAFT_414577 [Corynespora cassiicola Philippines]|uniref:Uncharacterized protein n=1 Tax=Corynespora cassiicola Philippines TaxID=1448308 RepID=A0A2T2NMY5_CORCC|nr:hypothetical protein BS50DRAFT_414577 [Corynespora cassiicola Philippines]
MKHQLNACTKHFPKKPEEQPPLGRSKQTESSHANAQGYPFSPHPCLSQASTTTSQTRPNKTSFPLPNPSLPIPQPTNHLQPPSPRPPKRKKTQPCPLLHHTPGTHPPMIATRILTATPGIRPRPQARTHAHAPVSPPPVRIREPPSPA